MSELPPDARPTSPELSASNQRILYTANTVLGVLNTPEQLEAAVEALKAGGFLDSEVQIAAGAAVADALHASTGRRGLAGFAVRVAERLGLEDEEMEFKAHYERELRSGHYVVLVTAPSAERKGRAAELLRAHGGHSVSFHGRFTIEGLVPPRDA